MSKTLYIETHGCQMNEYDSARMADVLRESSGLTLVERPEEADVLLLNTCSIREKAQEKVFSQLGRWRPLKVLGHLAYGIARPEQLVDFLEREQIHEARELEHELARVYPRLREVGVESPFLAMNAELLGLVDGVRGTLRGEVTVRGRAGMLFQESEGQLVLALHPVQRLRCIDIFQPTVGVRDLGAMIIIDLVHGFGNRIGKWHGFLQFRAV